MILRKPYAFLIKYFKLIHLVLTTALIYIAYKTNKLFSFFDVYLSSRKYEVIDNLSNIYIGVYLYLIIILIIAISVIIFLLMYKKDKPVKYYIVLIIYYFLLFIAFIFSGIQLNNISFNEINIIMIQICKDLLLVFFITQLPLIVVSLIRTVGFNIKKFNFQKDLMEIGVDEKDNEEFELDVDIDSSDVKARFRRRNRIIGYVLKENKLAIIISVGIISIVGGIIIQNTIYAKNYVYKENKWFSDNGIDLKAIDSYQYSTDFFGNDISNDKHDYVIVRVKAKNNTSEDRKIYTKNFTLKINDDIYSVSIKDKDNFIPLGDAKESIIIESKKEKVFIVIFKIDKTIKKSSKIMEYAGSYKVKDRERVYNVNRVKLEPKVNGNNEVVKIANIGEELNFKGSILEDTSIIINSFDLKDRYVYTYKQCLPECHSFNDYIVPKINTKYDITIMRLDYNIKVDEDLYNDKLSKKLINSAGHIRYVINGKEKKQAFNIIDITPEFVKDYKYFEIKGEAREANEIYLDFIIYNKTYTYVLKKEA